MQSWELNMNKEEDSNKEENINKEEDGNKKKNIDETKYKIIYKNGIGIPQRRSFFDQVTKKIIKR